MVCSTAVTSLPSRSVAPPSPADHPAPNITARSSTIAHVAALPCVRVTGDTAFAISYLQILVPDRVGPMFEVPNHGSSQGFHVHRVSANRWDFVRTEDGWRIKRRKLRSLDGSAPASEILCDALTPSGAR